MVAAEGASEFQGQLSEYMAHFACRLLIARPATDQHVIAFRNYALAIDLYAKAETGTIQLISARHINELYATGLRQAYVEDARSDARELAEAQLAPRIGTWRRYLRNIRACLRPEVGSAIDARELLGGLAAGHLTYADV